MEAMCQNYDVLVDEKRKRPDDQIGSSKKHETREVVRWREELSPPQMITKRGKERIRPAFKLCSEIEQSTDLKRVMEERILDSLELTFQNCYNYLRKRLEWGSLSHLISPYSNRWFTVPKKNGAL